MAISRMQQPRQMYQDGSIMPRLNELGTEVSSAEQMLQEINQRLQSAESTLGEGGAMQTSAIGSGFMQPVSMNNPQAPDLRAIPESMKDPSYQPPQMALPENPMSGGLMQSPLAGAMRNMAASGGMMGRQNYGLGSLVKSIGKTVKKVVKSDLGKAALLAAGGYYLGGGSLLGAQRAGMSGFKFANLPGFTGAKNLFMGKPLGFKTAGDAVARSGGILDIGKKFIGSTAGQVGIGAALSALAASGMDQEEIAEIENDPEKLRMYLKDYYSKTNPDASGAEIEEFVRINSATGGRIGLEGGANEDFQKYLKGREEFNKKQNAEQLYKEYLENKRREKVAEQKTMAANGGLMPTGIMRANKAGTIERDYRETGGFVPIGIKEKADDVPAMLSKNEFVMTADAVRGMGDGNIEKGAQRLYDQMKTMEKRVV